MAATAALTLSTRYQVIDGVGCLGPDDNSGPALTDADADHWAYTIGISIIRSAWVPWRDGQGVWHFGIGSTVLGHLGDVSSSSPLWVGAPAPGWAYTYTNHARENLQKLSARGVRVMLTGQLFAPTQVNAWNSTVKSDAGTRNDIARCFNDLLSDCQASGINVVGISPVNEPDTTDWAYGPGFTPSDLYDLVHNYVAPAFRAHSFQTGLVMPQLAYPSNLASYLSPFGALADIDFVNAHDYTGVTLADPGHGKRVWMDEYTFPTDTGMTSGGGGLALAQRIHRLFTTWGANGASMFNHINWGTAERYLSRTYALGNFCKVRPGSQRAACVVTGDTGVSATAYVGPDGTIVVVAFSTNAGATTLNVTGAAGGANATPWITDATRNLAQQTDVAVSAGAFSYSLPGSSVVSFVVPVPVNLAGDRSDAVAVGGAQDGSYQTPGRLTYAAGPVVGGKVTLSGHRSPGSIITEG